MKEQRPIRVGVKEITYHFTMLTGANMSSDPVLPVLILGGYKSNPSDLFIVAPTMRRRNDVKITNNKSGSITQPILKFYMESLIEREKVLVVDVKLTCPK